MIAALGHFCIVGRGCWQLLLSVWPFILQMLSLYLCPCQHRTALADSLRAVTNMSVSIMKVTAPLRTTMRNVYSILHSSFFILYYSIVFSTLFSKGYFTKLLSDAVAGICLWNLWFLRKVVIKLTHKELYIFMSLLNTMWTSRYVNPFGRNTTNLLQIRPTQLSGEILHHLSLHSCFSSAVFLGCMGVNHSLKVMSKHIFFCCCWFTSVLWVALLHPTTSVGLQVCKNVFMNIR